MANHILIGIGGTGYKVLRDFRKRLWTEVPDLTKRNQLPIKFLYVDSDASATPAKLRGNEDLRVNGQDTAITEAEYMDIRNIDLNAIFNNLTSYPNLRHVIGNGAFVRNCIGEVGAAAGQKRRAGRILFAANAHNFNSKLTSLIGDLQRQTGNSNDLNIYVFAGLAGGTGSGSIVDAVAQILVKHPDANLEVFAMIPEKIAPKGADAGRYHANGYAALMELSALNVGSYLPADVSNGNEHITLPHPDRNNQFNLTVYSNVNRNGATVDSYTTLPSLVADLMYFRLFNGETEAMKQLNRGFKNENRPDYLVEYKTNTRPGKPVERARTKAVGSFGIKRVRYPDDKLTAHVSDTMAKNIVSMMLYLNYDNDRGFISEKPRHDAKDYGEYINQGNLKNWKLSDADLSLSVPILKPTNGQTVKTFDDFWGNEVALDYDYKSAKNMGQPLQILEQYFDERYQSDFREEKGVEAYFQSKSNDQVVTDSAEAIVSNIQNSLFNKWVQGQLSAYDVKQVTEKILEMLQQKNSNLTAEEADLEKEIEKYVEDRAILMDEYGGTGWLKNALNKSKENLFVEYSKLLADEYSDRTRLASIKLFQKALLPKLIQRFMDLQTEIQKFVGRLEDSEGEYGVMIGQNTPEENPDIKANIVEISENVRLKEFEDRLRRDRSKMENMAQNYRSHLAEGAGNSFAKLTTNINSTAKLKDAADKVLDELVEAYHAEMMKQKPVLGLNVLEQIKEKYGKDENSVGQFATSIVQNSEVFITLDDQEVNKKMRNTESPTSTPAAGPNTLMLVAIPQIETDDEELKRFIEVLKIKLSQAFNETETRKFYLAESPRKNEITIVTYQNIFPLRAINYMPFLRSKFEELVNTSNQTTNTTNKILLFSEGDGSLLPPLEGEGEGPKGDDLIKYIFLAVALGLIKEGEDEYGNKGWGQVVVDDFGAEMFTLLSPSFTGIITAPDFTPEVIENLVEKIDEDIRQPRHVQKKAEMSDTIKALMKDKVLPEVGSPTHEMYKRYAAKAREAMETVSK